MERWLDLQWNNRLRAEGLEDISLADYQLMKIRETFSLAVKNSPFYRDIYDGYELPASWDEFEKIPFTSARDLRQYGMEMICVPQSRISRIVTLPEKVHGDALVQTSGTTGKPKRVFYTEEDQQLTVDYFSYGMRYMVSPGDTCCVLMSHRTPGSVGDLLRQAFDKIGVKTVFEYRQGLDCLIGAPEQVKTLCDSTGDGNTVTPPYPCRVLLSAEQVSEEAVRAIEQAWGSRVYEHYGMTEMGLGCAVSCGEAEGYHVREYDLYVELIDPDTGASITRPAASESVTSPYGEIVFTTLNRKGMPFIRYRTGDMSRWLPFCPCGSIMARLDRVQAREFDKYNALTLAKR